MNIWNCDESGVQDLPKEEQVIGVTDEMTHLIKHIEQGKTTIILTFANACGQLMPFHFTPCLVIPFPLTLPPTLPPHFALSRYEHING